MPACSGSLLLLLLWDGEVEWDNGERETEEAGWDMVRDWDWEIWVEMRASGIQEVMVQEMPRKIMRMEVDMKVGVTRVEMVRRVVRRWEMVQARGRVRDLMRRRESIVGFWFLDLGEDEEMNSGSVRFEMRATIANRIMMKVAWRIECGDGGSGEAVVNVRVEVAFLDIGVYSASS